MICNLSRRFVFLFSVVASLVFPGGAFGNFLEFSVGGTSDPNSILTKVDEFRAAIGGINNGNAPGTVGGRREINWDGGSTNNFNVATAGTPFNGFLDTRGAQFTTSGTGFVQAPPAALEPLVFGVFSLQRIFSPIGSNITDVSFFIPGTSGSVPAAVSGFGAVFTSVDLANTTSIQFFGASNNLLYSQFVEPGIGDKNLSFLGAIGNAGEEIASVRITTGNTPFDLVAMDDFIYPEPRRVPDAGGIGLMGLGLGFILLCYRRFLPVS
jgi:hypothetical protein